MQGNLNIPQRNTSMLVLVAVALFVIGTGLHIALGAYPKTIDVMPDEMRYLDTARSLFSGHGLVMRGEASSFQKILYPIAIAPALFFPDGVMQIRAINVLNSIYACSSVFPVLVLGLRMFRQPAPIIGSMLAVMMLPDLMYSMTFMTESLFIPITLWLVALVWRCLQSSGNAELGLAGAAGLLCYVVYLCKEVAWMFLIAFITWYIMAMVKHRRSTSQGLMAIGMFLIGFLLPFVMMKLTLFSGMLNSYSQFSFDILLSPYTVLFGLYATATDAVYFIVGFGIFPVIYLVCMWRDIPLRYRDLAFFCLFSLLIGLAVVVFTISMREDVGHVALRQHLRYVIPLFLPLLMLFVKQVAHGSPVRLLRNGRRRAIAAGITAAFCVLVLGFFGSANLSQGFDNSQFHFMRYSLEGSQPLEQQYYNGWADTLQDIDPDDGALLEIDPVNWMWRFAVVVFTIVGMRYLLHRRESVRILAGGNICIILAIFMVSNSICAYGYNMKAYSVDEPDIEEICAINDILENRDEFGQVFLVIDDGNTKNNNLIDTYVLDGPGNYRYLTPDELEVFAKTEADSERSQPSDPVRYLLINNKQGITVKTKGVEVLDDPEGRFTLYRFPDNAPLKVKVKADEDD